jgi:hypothetical protein
MSQLAEWHFRECGLDGGQGEPTLAERQRGA